MASLALAFDVIARDRASKTFDHVGASAESAGRKGRGLGIALKGALAAAGAAVAAVGIGAFAAESISAFKSTSGAATGLQRAIGGTVEDASRLNFAAKESGVSTDSFARSMKLLAKNIGDAGGKAAPGAKALKALGIAGKDAHGNTRPIADLLPQIAEHFKDMPNGADKSALAMKLFGRAGLEMLPMLNKGKEGISDLMKESDKFGLTIGTKQAADVKKAIVAQRQWHAALEGVKVQIGVGLLPLLTDFLGFFRGRLIPVVVEITGRIRGFFTAMQSGNGAISKLRDAFTYLFTDGADGAQSFGEIVDNIFGNSGRLVGPLRAVSQIVKDVILGFRAMFLAFKDGDVTSNGVVGAFERIGVYAKTVVVPAVMGIVSAVRGFVAVALPIVQQFVAGMMARIGPLMPQIRAVFASIGQIVVGVMALIRAVIQRVTAIIGFIWSHWGSQIMNFTGAIFRAILNVISGVLKVIQGVIKVVTSIIKGDWSGAWAGMKQIASGAWQAIKGIVSAAITVVKAILSVAWAGIKAAAGAAWSAIKSGISSAWSGIKSAVSSGIGAVVSLVRGLPGKARDALGSLGGFLAQAGRDLIQGMINGIAGMAGAIARAAGDVVGNAIAAAKAKLHISSPSRVFMEIGHQTGAGLVLGLNAQAGAVRAATQSMIHIPTVNTNRLGGAAGGAGGSVAVAGAGGGTYAQRMHPHDAQAIGREVAAAMQTAPVTVSAGTIDRAVGGTLR